MRRCRAAATRGPTLKRSFSVGGYTGQPLRLLVVRMLDMWSTSITVVFSTPSPLHMLTRTSVSHPAGSFSASVHAAFSCSGADSLVTPGSSA